MGHARRGSDRRQGPRAEIGKGVQRGDAAAHAEVVAYIGASPVRPEDATTATRLPKKKNQNIES